MSEQSDTLGLLSLNDRKSRHLRFKKQRHYERSTYSGIPEYDGVVAYPHKLGIPANRVTLTTVPT